MGNAGRKAKWEVITEHYRSPHLVNWFTCKYIEVIELSELSIEGNDKDSTETETDGIKVRLLNCLLNLIGNDPEFIEWCTNDSASELTVVHEVSVLSETSDLLIEVIEIAETKRLAY